MKKMLIIAAALVASVNANATNAGDSWAKIFADNSLIVTVPYKGTFGPNGIFNACATATEFKSLTPVKVCVERTWVDGIGEGPDAMGHYECVKYENQMTSALRSGVSHSCVKLDMSEHGYPNCLEYADVPFSISTKFNVDVVRTTGDAQEVFTKSFVVPACAQ
jgi:hypothetical protein